MDKLPGAAPRDWLELRLEVAGTGRRVASTAHGPASAALEARWLAEL
jgi:hypothetical protein